MTKENQQEPQDFDEVPFGANSLRLSTLEWLITIAIVSTILIAAPLVWKRSVPFTARPDFRVPYDLSDDYWIYSRLSQSVKKQQEILIIGDSVVWGEYVRPNETLSHYLNQHPGKERFANGGLNGTHPLALRGLIDDFCKSVSDSHVILHCNLLWTSSPERDLRGEKELSFNHPRLVPQFAPWLSCYKATVNERVGVVIDRRVAYRSWVHHFRVACFEGQDVHSWTLEHPTSNPLRQLEFKQPAPTDSAHSRPASWLQRGIPRQDMAWVNLNKSLQWGAFRSSVRTLESRGNRVFVIIGPFNEHMLTPDSQTRYRSARQQVESWLAENQVAYYAPTPLPTDEYGDASHPLRDGYVRLAKNLHQHAAFRAWLRAAR